MQSRHKKAKNNRERGKIFRISFINEIKEINKAQYKY